MSPRGNNPQKQCYANAKQKPQKNTHAGELSIEITLLNHTSHWSFPINSLYTHRKPPRRIFLESRFCTDIQLVKILKLDFVKRNLLKVKTHETIDISWLPYDWLWLLKTFIYIIWQNFLVREKKISLYSWYTWINSKIWFTGIRS